MGNTVLAHALYACAQVDINFETFFSSTGNSHRVASINGSCLTAEHLIEYPNNDVKCIIEIKTTDWCEVLKLKMSYAKWCKEYPEESTILKFFNTYSPAVTVLEFLSISYYDMLNEPVRHTFTGSEMYHLDDYLNNNVTTLKNTIIKHTNWTWDDNLSLTFYQHMSRANKSYVEWLANIKLIFFNTVNKIEMPVDLAFWERAILIATVCRHYGINPNKLHWDTIGCFFKSTNVSLITSLERLHHDKTI
jgi:hypothetical protein